MIESEDFDFYKKVNVLPPTFCYECRLQRRLVWRNERSLYRRKCDGTGKDIISIYPPEKKVKVYDQKYWWSDAWNPLSYGRAYDFSRSFFDQFKELISEVPLINVFNSNAVNSDYCNFTVNHKNCYLVAAGWNNEEVNYSSRASFCKDSIDLFICHKIELGYYNISCKNSYQLFFSIYSENCSDSAFLYDCNNCQSCFGCTNLRGKSYCIFNTQYSKEEYKEKLKELSLGSWTSIQKHKEVFRKLRAGAIHRYAHILKSKNVTGDNVEQAKNCHYCFDLAGDVENSKYSHWGTYGLKDVYDTGPGTGGKSELIYETVSSGVQGMRLAFTVTAWYCTDSEYSFNCHSSRNVFGSVSLKNNEYCILNKQYSKEDYIALVKKIKDQMAQVPYVDKGGRVYRYGEFFPIELSPFAYNITVAQDYLPITKEEALEKSYEWRDVEGKNYIATVAASSLPDRIDDVQDSIMNEVIACTHNGTCNELCTTAFKIVPQELLFYKKIGLALPRLCPNCRYHELLKERNPLKLWHRQCMCDYLVHPNSVKHAHHSSGRCSNQFETSYAPDRKETIYCEQCYQAEVV